MVKKNLKRANIIVTKQTYWNLKQWAAFMGYGEKDIGRVIDKLVREKALSMHRAYDSYDEIV